MHKFHIKKTLLMLLVIGILSIITGLTSSSFAQQTLVCPTSAQKGSATLQLIPCYVISPAVASPSTFPSSGAPIPSTNNPIMNLPLPPGLPNPGNNQQPGAGGGGGVCESDSIETTACTCPSYEEEDNICSDPNCIADGGDPWTPFQLDNRTGAPANANCSFTLHESNAADASSGSGSGSGSGCVKECNSKPIIYLYPQQTTNVNVKLSMQGHVTVSDPLYPSNGWKNIEAHPDGTLIYQNKTYRELYYESETIKATPLKQGIFIPTAQLKPELKKITLQLGLNEFESNEFLDYWVPSLTQIHTPYILFSIFSPEEKAKVDQVQVTPQPDTTIEFLAYFKPVAAPYPLEALTLPQPPARNGFTIVEWGGTIDRQ